MQQWIYRRIQIAIILRIFPLKPLHEKMNIPYRINQIKTVQFAIFPDKYVNGEDVSVNANFNFNISNDLTTIRCISSFTYSQKENLLLTIEIQCFLEFRLEERELKSWVKKEGDMNRVSSLHGNNSYRNRPWRKIIHAKTENTVLNWLSFHLLIWEAIKNDLTIKTKCD